jgi:glutathione S-transferase
MTDLILHQYEISPFSEKVRRILAFKGLPWSAVRAPAVMPKPDLIALTGGYRKIPVLQIGNHVYCDSALIARVLEQLKPEPTLYPSPLTEALSEWSDTALFEACVPTMMRPTRLDELLTNFTQYELSAMLEDRRLLRQDALRLGPTPKSSRTHLDVYLARLDAGLARQNFVFGDAPCIADFSTYHSLWMLQRVSQSPFGEYPQLAAWMQRIAGIPQATVTPISSDDALGVCRSARNATTDSGSAVFADPMGFTREQAVLVRASDYGRDIVAGALVGSSPNEVVLRRTDERVGTVFVHFPRLGFEISPAEREQTDPKRSAAPSGS